MKLNEIREIVAFMKEAGVCELEYKERSTSIRLKLTPPAPQRPWNLFRAAAPETPEAPEAEDAEPVEDEGTNVEIDLNEAAEKVCKGVVKAGSAVVDTVKAGASYLKTKRDEYLAGGTPGAYDVELSEAEESEAAPEAEAPEAAPEREEMPVVGEVPQYEPQSAPEASDAEEDDGEPVEPPVKLDTDAAREAVARTAEAVVNTAKAAVALGVAGVRRGGALLSDLLHPASEDPDPWNESAPEPSEEAEAPSGEAEAAETPVEESEAPEAPAEEPDSERKDEE